MHPANHLAGQTSPYLLQHLHNPVEWYPWGPEALARATAANKLLIVSVGYAACHWCHVMERESFEDEGIAELMNTHFISIKVDREERPDIDAVYMDAVQTLTGRGGWPMNVVCLPDGKPIWGGTYFPKDHWQNALRQLAKAWRERPEEFTQQANDLTAHLQKLERTPTPADQPSFSQDELTKALMRLMGRFDSKWGGFEGAPKFPTPVFWEMLLRHVYYTQDPTAQAELDTCLTRVAWGGIFDHVGGGWARYSVDAQWHVPHFEKMLYDNGQLLQLYSNAYRAEPKPLFRQAVRKTIEFMQRELRSPEGGFYSALDADSEGVEGKFYVWTAQEFDEVVGTEVAGLMRAYYNVSEAGNWEDGVNVLMRTVSDEAIAEQAGVSLEALQTLVREANQKLLERRQSRVRPGLDDKQLTSWNALAISGLVAAFQAFGEPADLAMAEETAQFIRNHLADGHRLNRSFKNGEARINAYLDDYAFSAEAFLSLYQATFNPAYLHQADRWAGYVLQHFNDTDSALLFYTSNEDPPLVTRKKEIYDSVTPSACSSMAHVLLTLGHLLERPAYLKRAQAMLATLAQHTSEHIRSFSNWGRLMQRFIYPDHVVVITGPEANRKAHEFQRRFLPNAILAGTTSEPTSDDLALLQRRFKTDTPLYVCQGHTCQQPTTAVAQAQQLVRTRLTP